MDVVDALRIVAEDNDMDSREVYYETVLGQLGVRATPEIWAVSDKTTKPIAQTLREWAGG